MLTPWDEFLCHQLPTTMDHVLTSDPAWTERIYISLYNVADKDMILGCGIGQYPNKNVQDGFATVSDIANTCEQEKLEPAAAL